ncbi:MAG: PLD nuclease N-terminal domain-containing protein [Peptococcaceae bacterium]|nr:PLD nuclease N-terminal domain-containing protein [Peptococcaceae bacterium]
MEGFDFGALDSTMETLMRMLPLLIIFSVLELGLMIAALVHLIRSQQPKYLSKAIWAIIIILVNLIGPVLYFVLGRNENVDDDDDDDEIPDS